MKRGDVVVIAGRSDFANRGRPAIIVQADAFAEHHPALTVCPITSTLTGDAFFRVAIAPDDANGLQRESEIEIDRLQAVWGHRINRTIGTVSEDILFTVDQALRRWLAL